MPRTILVIDDQQQVLDLADRMLTPSGFLVVTAINPEDGIAKLGRERFDLVLTDIDMPQMDGLALILRVKTLYPRIPIVAMSGTVFQGQGVRYAVELGASAAIGKPFRRAELLSLIEQFAPAA